MTPARHRFWEETSLLQPSEPRFESILFLDGPPADIDSKQAPEYFTDLNLDQIVSTVIAGYDEYNLAPFFYVPLGAVERIQYRYAVFRDLESEVLLAHIQRFVTEMRKMRAQIAQAGKLRCKLQKQAWFLDAVDIYCGAVRRLSDDLNNVQVRSPGLLGFRDFLAAYVSSAFTELDAATEELKRDLSRVRYSLLIDGPRITVGRYQPAADYGAEVLKTFEKFKQTAVKGYAFDFHDYVEMNHVEEGILGIVADLFAETFSKLDRYCAANRNYADRVITRFDREIQFYIASINYWKELGKGGVVCCYPAVSGASKEICGHDVCDLALAAKLLREKATVVANDFFLRNAERIIVVTGPNQGGKTTFARAFGQLHHLANIGFPVAGSDARLFVFDRIFTHFEKEEDVRDLRGKLEEDLIRIHRILEAATPSSIVIMNESFLSTTLKDALFLSRAIMQRLIELDLLCVSVTFLDELASLGPETVSMVSSVDPGNPAIRTFKLLRRPADGLAHAAALADKYRLGYESVRERIASKQAGGLA